MQLVRPSLRQTRRRFSLYVVQPARLLIARDTASGISLRELRGIERSITATSEWRALRRSARQLQRGLGATSPADASKYLEVDLWLRANLLRAARLGLHRTTGLSVLDLGCGSGLFLHVCRSLGHHATGVDLSLAELTPVEKAVYGVIPPLLGLDVLRERITCAGQLAVPRRYDIITAFMVCFNGHNSAAEWGAREWRAFTGGIASHLEPEGRLHLGLNARPGEPRASRFHGAATADWWKQCRGETHAGAATMTREGMLAAPSSARHEQNASSD